MKTKKILQLSAVLLMGALLIGTTGCKKWGCTDELADNYDENAKKDNGTCEYDDYLTTLDDAAYDAASACNGGLMYNKFWVSESGWSLPSGADYTVADITDYSNFYRCKQCHGWDYRANEGYYIDRAPNAGRPSVSGANLWEHAAEHNPRELFDQIKNPGGRKVDPALTSDGTNGKGDAMPDWGLILTDAQIWDLVKFLKEGMIDPTTLYDLSTSGTYPSGSKTISNIGTDGDAVAGNAYYQTNCSSCHTSNGTTIPGMTETVGWFLRDEPHEIQHLVKYGMPGEPMMTQSFVCNITATEMKNLYKALADPVAFPD